MKSFKEFLKESISDEEFDKIRQSNEEILKEMESIKFEIDGLFHNLGNSIAYGRRVKPHSMQLEKYCKELINLNKKLKEQV